MNFEESKKAIPPSLLSLYEQTIELNSVGAWRRLYECIASRMDGLTAQRRRLLEAGDRTIKSGNAYVAVQKKIKSTPNTPLRFPDLLDLTFEAGALYAIFSLDKCEYEALNKKRVDLDGQWEATFCFAKTIGEQMSRMCTIGAQLGSDYYRRKGANYPSFPARPPLHPTATPLLVGQDVEQTEFCHCIYCHEDVEIKTFDSASGKCKCEDHLHLKCGHMLTTRINQGGDQREPFNPDKNRDMTKP